MELHAKLLNGDWCNSVPGRQIPKGSPVDPAHETAMNIPTMVE